jgi:hypothetical protein
MCVLICSTKLCKTFLILRGILCIVFKETTQRETDNPTRALFITLIRVYVDAQIHSAVSAGFVYCWASGIVARPRVGRSGVRIPTGAKYFVLSKTAKLALCATQSSIQYAPEFFPGEKQQRVMVTTDLNLAPRLRMSGAVHLLPLYVFMVLTEKTLIFTFILKASTCQYCYKYVCLMQSFLCARHESV